MITTVTLDRYEDGPQGTLAIVLTDDDRVLALPRDLLPPEAMPGDVLRLTLTIDADATTRLQADVRRLQDELRTHDRGEDVTL